MKNYAVQYLSRFTGHWTTDTIVGTDGEAAENLMQLALDHQEESVRCVKTDEITDTEFNKLHPILD